MTVCMTVYVAELLHINKVGSDRKGKKLGKETETAMTCHEMMLQPCDKQHDCSATETLRLFAFCTDLPSITS